MGGGADLTPPDRMGETFQDTARFIRDIFRLRERAVMSWTLYSVARVQGAPFICLSCSMRHPMAGR